MLRYRGIIVLRWWTAAAAHPMTQFAAVKAKPGRWLDTDEDPTPEVCAAVVAAGYVGWIGYVPFAHQHAPECSCITPSKAAIIVEAGLQLGFVQHVRYPDKWRPRDCSGAADGLAAVQWVREIDPCADDCTLFQDLEGASIGTTAEETMVFAEQYGQQMQNPGLYDGYQMPWTPDQKWELPRVHCYWADLGRLGVSHRGYLILQGHEVTIAGVRFDLDLVRDADDLGENNLIILARVIAPDIV